MVTVDGVTNDCSTLSVEIGSTPQPRSNDLSGTTNLSELHLLQDIKPSQISSF